MKIALHFCAYEATEFLDRFLDPWLKYKEREENELLITAGHVCFKEFQEMGYSVESKDGTYAVLEKLTEDKKIDHLFFTTDPLTEAEARTKIFEPVKDCDLLIITAPDEIFEVEQIENAVNYTKKDPFIVWYRLEYRNLTFTDRQYVKGFTPPRFFFNNRGYKIERFHADDELTYKKDGH